MVKKPEVTVVWGEKASLYSHIATEKKIASITMSKIGFIIAWHEFVPPRISQRLSSIWNSVEAAEFVIYAATAETINDLQKKESKS